MNNILTTDITKAINDLNETSETVTFTLYCRIGLENCYLSKTGYVDELSWSTEKPKQSYFYINYKKPTIGGGVRFKVAPHEVISILDSHGDIIYSAPSESKKLRE